MTQSQALSLPHNLPLDKDDRLVCRSLKHCQQITRTHAKNFYYGLKLSPGIKREALYAIYAFMRACDDLVDQPPNQPIDASSPTTQELAKRIDQFRACMEQVIQTGQLPPGIQVTKKSIWPAFGYVMNTWDIDPLYLHAMLDGQKRDLSDQPFATFEDLYDYCYKVAGVVGLTCISVWEYVGGQATRRLAEHRGIAFQLTNILRDLKEDYQRGRVYLPQEDLERFGVDPAVFGGKEPDANFDRLIKFQLERARSYYEDAAGLDDWIEPRCQSTDWAMTKIYRRLLDKIADDPRRVLHERVRLSRFEKSKIALQAKLRPPRVRKNFAS